nr:hypothetical protein BaRGS_011205 [Batillaria attramentaria]
MKNGKYDAGVIEKLININLLILLHNLLPFLIRQQLDFRVFVVEQTGQSPFNRCLMFNVGYKESQRYGNFSCFIVHDADLLPRDYRNLYRCDVNPRHFVISRSNKPFKGQELLGTVAERMLTDGLSSLRYSVEDFQLRELYTCSEVRVSLSQCPLLCLCLRPSGLDPLAHYPRFSGQLCAAGFVRL